MNRIFNRMNTVPLMDEVQYSPQERMDQLKLLKLSDEVKFKMPQSDTSDLIEYFPLDTLGLHFADINGDDQPDLLYSGQAGYSGVLHTKVFYRKNDSLIFDSTIPGRVVSLEKVGENRMVFYLVSNPCCDSYTGQIIKYLHLGPTLIRQYTLSIVGEVKTRGMPAIDNEPVKSLPQLDLYADQFDFRSTTTYFGDRTNEIHAILRTGKMVKLLSLDRPVLVEILYTKTIDEQKWHLVLTESLDDIPNSLYEWSEGDKMRFIGWTKFE
ncbi:MAG: hypothetical protein RIC35_14240 [Marinoscillum sp.]